MNAAGTGRVAPGLGESICELRAIDQDRSQVGRRLGFDEVLG